MPRVKTEPLRSREELPTTGQETSETKRDPSDAEYAADVQDLSSEGTPILFHNMEILGYGSEKHGNANPAELRTQGYEILDRLIPVSERGTGNYPQGSRPWKREVPKAERYRRLRDAIYHAGDFFARSLNADEAAEKMTRFATAVARADEAEAKILISAVNLEAFEGIGARSFVSGAVRDRLRSEAEQITDKLLSAPAAETPEEKQPEEEPVSPEERKKALLDWAATYGYPAEWVDQTFTIDESGKVTLDNRKSKIRSIFYFSGRDHSKPYPQHLPPGISEVTGNYDLGGADLLDLSGFPDRVGGDVDLGTNYKLTSIDGLVGKAVGGNIDMKNFSYPKFKIPEGILLSGHMIMPQGQFNRDFLREAEQAGYFVIEDDWRRRE